MKREDRIEKYLSGELNADELKEFEALLDKDESFKKQFQFHKEVYRSISKKKEIDLLEKLESIHHSKIDSNKSRIRFLSKWPVIGIAATLFLVFGVLSIIRLNQAAGPEELFNEYYTAPSVDLYTRSSNTDPEMISFEAKYSKESYSQALELMEQYLSDKNDLQGEFYKSICLIELERFEEAEQILISLSEHPLLSDLSNWYLLMIYLKQESIENARIQLDLIANDDTNEYQKQAKDILSSME